jgi:methionine-rich copper-binding protein CopC
MALTLASLLPAQPAAAEYYMQLSYLMATGGVTGQQVYDGSTVDRFTTQFQYTFSDRLDPASLPGNVTVTDGTGTSLTWQTDASDHLITLHPPGPLSPAASYTLLVRGGPDGVKNADGAPLQGDVTFHVTTNDLPFRLNQIQDNGDPLADGGVLRRNASSIQLIFTHPLQAAAVAPAIHVTRSDGTDANWTVSEVQGARVTLTFPGHLPMAAETYTIAVTGGDQGLRDILGEPLTADVHFALHTLNQPYVFSVRLPTNYHRFAVVQTDHFRFQAHAGDLAIGLEAGSRPVLAQLVVVDEQANQRILERELRVDTQAAVGVTLPHDGRYGLYVFGNRLEYLTLTAPELDFPTITPAIDLPAIPDFTTENDPFSFTPHLFNPTETERVTIWRDGTLLTQNALGADGQIQPTTVDTTGLQDGVYNIYAIGKSVGSDNTGYTWLPILVDRVDTFTDVPHSHWAHNYIEVMYHLGIVNGVDATSYAPARAVTRAEFAKLLTLTLGLQPAAPSAPNPFVDIDTHWAKPYILALYQAGLVNGDVRDGQRYFDPQATVDRAQAATMLGRALGVSNQPVNGRPFSDWDQVPDWAKPYVAALAQAGWINGFPDGTFRPADPLNRDQAAKLLAKFIGM